MARPNDSLRPVHPGRVGAGAVVMAMGIVMLLDRSDLVGPYAWRAFPGFILVLLGLTGAIGNWRACAGRRGTPLSGLWLILVGCWLIVNALNFFGMTYRTSWPFLIIAAGTMVVLREVFPGLREDREERN
jgi:hypothetical protein